MISKTLTALLISAFSFSAWSGQTAAPAAPAVPPVAVVSRINGEVLFNGQKLKLNDLIEQPGELETKAQSFVQLKIEKWKNTITVGPSSKMAINLKDEKKYTFEDGTCRWKTYETNKDPNAAKGTVFTKYASMGVRGTDFTIKSSTWLGETELYMFDGEVEFANIQNPSDKVTVKKGQWVGIGGRFGQKVSPVINLPDTVMSVLEKQLKY